MILRLHRFHSGKDETLGLLYIDGQFFCYTLEDEYREVKVKGETRIPDGTYDLVKRFSPKWQKEMVYLEDVPNFTGIAIHPGNTTGDTSGCLLVGYGQSYVQQRAFLSHSRQAYNDLMDRLKPKIGEEACEIQIISDLT